MAVVGLCGTLLAHSPAPSASPTKPMEIDDTALFPSADQISEVLGVSVESQGVQSGLSQAWEGSDFDPETLPSAHMAVYASPPDDDGQLTGVVIDIIRFESVDEAVTNVEDTMFGDDEVLPGFETELDGDFLATISGATDDAMGVSVIFMVTGPVAVSVTAVATDVPEMEAESEAIVGLILDRLRGDS